VEEVAWFSVARQGPPAGLSRRIGCTRATSSISTGPSTWETSSIVAAIEACTGAKCQVNVGKPDPIMLETIMDLIGLEAKDCVMSGDRLYTEIRMAKAAGMPSAVVLTGETTEEDLAGESEENLPDYALERIDQLVPRDLWDEFG
jgi:ribonucleotide monophosphatase NagD (HAD superfamily)